MTERLDWVVATLGLDTDADVLEIGCGGGVAANLVCARLETGSLTAIDRSATQIDRATRRNAAHVASGKARFLTCSLEALALPDGSFDTIFAASVNLFWVRPAHDELAILRRVLRPHGALFLFYEEFTDAKAAEVESRLLRHLHAARFEPSAARTGRRVAVTARPSTRR